MPDVAPVITIVCSFNLLSLTFIIQAPAVLDERQVAMAMSRSVIILDDYSRTKETNAASRPPEISGSLPGIPRRHPSPPFSPKSVRARTLSGQK
jgi:hypothetical protein